jgi:hypothetical protein
MNFARNGLAALALATAFAGGAAYAETMTMDVELSGAQQVPPVETSASGTAEVTYDTETRKLSWELEYTGLSGDATAAHIHGPADEGENAPPVFPIKEASGSEGSEELTEEQAELLMDGKMYINVHTAANPDGEIRGQVKPAM